MTLFLLYEAATGYAVFNVISADHVNREADAIQNAYTDFARYKNMVKLVSFKPFITAQTALENANAISENRLTEDLKSFLEIAMPTSHAAKNFAKINKRHKVEKNVILGVQDPYLGADIKHKLGIICVSDEITAELSRGIRVHFHRYVTSSSQFVYHKAQLGLAHAFSRAKVKFNLKTADIMIIQAINLLEMLDEDINTFLMRVKEWYSWHFPELERIIPDDYQYVRAVMLLQGRANSTSELLDRLTKITVQKSKALAIIEAAKLSYGHDLSPIDLMSIEAFGKRVLQLTDYRCTLHSYLTTKMRTIAPNLSALIGEIMGARLISKAGAIINLAKYPASTIQILGAEKGLFRALKNNLNTPKHGLILHSSLIGKAKQRNKGRMSRYLANKCSIAVRIDAFMEGYSTDVFGKKLKEQVEERLRFYEDGIAPGNTLTAMREVLKSI